VLACAHQKAIVAILHQTEQLVWVGTALGPLCLVTPPFASRLSPVSSSAQSKANTAPAPQVQRRLVFGLGHACSSILLDCHCPTFQNVLCSHDFISRNFTICIQLFDSGTAEDHGVSRQSFFYPADFPSSNHVIQFDRVNTEDVSVCMKKKGKHTKL
jgi:hypothetical protein